MSGIAGIYYFNQQPVAVALIDKMANTLQHRGPHRRGVWRDANIGFACLLLQTTEESLGEVLPYYEQDAQVAITADARIDNRTNLLNMFGLEHVDPKTISDSRLILEAYKKWGIECHQHLLGDFAVVIWDQREQRLFVLRDHFGVKPLYYYASKDIFAFASEIRALLALPDIPCEINEERLADFVALQDDGRATFYKNISTLPPAHFLLSNHTAMKQNRYWSLEPGPLLKLRNNQEYAEAFKEVFFESVRCRLRRTGAIGSHLSGGLDSSSVACAARDILAREGNEKLHTFSFVFDDLPECDERKYINPIIEQGNIIPHFVQAELPTKEEYDVLQDTFEEPVAAFNVNPVWQIHTAAKGLGVNVLLDGWDGDSTVSHGIGRLVELSRSMHWLKLIREAKGYAGHFHIQPWKYVFYFLRLYSPLSGAFDKFSKMRKKLLNNLSSPSDKRKLEVDTFLANEFYKLIRAHERNESLRRPISKRDINEQSLQIEKLTKPGMVRSLGLQDRYSAHFSIDKRFPFWDKRLIAFCLSLPAAQKLNDGWNRVIMRRAMESSLPASVCWRGGKTNLTPHAMRFCQELVDIYQLRLQESIEKWSAFLNTKKVEGLFKRSESPLGEESSQQLHIIVALMIWLNHMEQLSGWEG